MTPIQLPTQLTPAAARRIVDDIWSAWAAIWFVWALRVKRTRMMETPASRLSYGVLTWIGAGLLFWPSLPLGPLGRRFVPGDIAVLTSGIVLTLCGIGLAIWSRAALGRNWSANVTIKTEHQLIRSGPYARIRHPIYSGILLALVGTTLVLGTWGATIGLVLIFISFWMKSAKEEEWLGREFGPAFDEHRRQTGRFVPRVS